MHSIAYLPAQRNEQREKFVHMMKKSQPRESHFLDYNSKIYT